MRLPSSDLLAHSVKCPRRNMVPFLPPFSGGILDPAQKLPDFFNTLNRCLVVGELVERPLPRRPPQLAPARVWIAPEDSGGIQNLHFSLFEATDLAHTVKLSSLCPVPIGRMTGHQKGQEMA